eukprot:CAMPEP_0170508520 /NCGR_PEP_ID=MMETSP0208-20121228/62582_1 /TAXON_ID=197538 /ORGANISM="Strombidium inclinatum, Strain S3" /LENGTH=84 /DNA_ID=CAMNT_0010791463 /DNA_START=1582 /DNA_END=1833 /DNA_ORIENTATION=-
MNKKEFSREYQTEFLGIDSPAPTKYNSHLKRGASDFHIKREESKTVAREERICPIVSKHQLSIPNVSPSAYLDIHFRSEFLKDK